MFDPNEWLLDQTHEHRVYADDLAQEYAVVDEADYQWAIQWKWMVNKPHPTRYGKKRYLRRSTGKGGRYKPPLYLHVEIMKRTGNVPPSELHVLVDHIDGDEFNCRRGNLRWATVVQNNNNRRAPEQVRAML